jgi:hypothetical protein
MAMPSIPGAPLLAFTRHHAVRRLPLASTPASSGQALASLPLPSASGYHLSIMDPCRHSHRGLPPHYIAPMLGAHPSFQGTAGKLRFSVPSALRAPAAGYLYVRGHNMHCSNCGIPVSDEANFCASCGQRLLHQPSVATEGRDTVKAPSAQQVVAGAEPTGAKPKSSVARRAILVLLWFCVVSISISYILLTLGEDPLRKQMATSLFFGYGFLAAMYSKRFKILWFFGGGVSAILVFGILDGLIRRVAHGLPL